MSKFRRLTVVFIVVAAIYIFIIFLKVINVAVDTDDWNNYGELDQKVQQKQNRLKVVKWKSAYWITEEEQSDDNYDEVIGVTNYDSSNSHIGRIWPYKGLQSEILSLKRSVRDTRPVG